MGDRRTDLELLDREIGRHGVVIGALVTRGFPDVTLGLTAVAAAVAAMDYGQIVFIVFPFVLSFIYAKAYESYQEVSARGFYKCHLEKRANELVGWPLYRWDSGVAEELIKKSFVGSFAGALGVLIWLAAYSFGIAVVVRDTFTESGDTLPLWLGVALLSAYAGLAVAMWRADRSWRTVDRRWSVGVCGEEPPPESSWRDKTHWWKR